MQLNKQFHASGLLLIYVAWIIGLLPSVIIGFKLISEIFLAAFDILTGSGNTDGDAGLAVLAMSAFAAIIVFAICQIVAMVLCPVTTFIFLNDYPAQRLIATMLVSLCTFLLPVGFILALFMGVFWLILPLVLLVFSPYFSWKITNKIKPQA